MTLLTPLALLGMLLLPALIALHLRRRQARSVEVPSLILWEELGGAPGDGGKRWHLEHLLLLFLQLLVASLLVASFARPAGSPDPAGTRVYVIDGGALMDVADPAPSRLAAAQALVAHDIRSAPAGTTFAIVVAAAQPRVLVQTTDSALALRRLAGLAPSAGLAGMRGALYLAAELLPARHGQLRILYARGEALPPIRAVRGLISVEPLGRDTDNQSIAALSVRCGSGGCAAFADVRNDGGAAVRDALSIEADGAVLGQKSLLLPPHSDTGVSFAVPARDHLLQLYLTRPDGVPADNLAWAVIPGPAPSTVTVVGDAKHTGPLVRALAASGDVRVVTVAPARFGRLVAGAPGLLVLAGWLPPGPLPAAPRLLLVEPPHLPGVPSARPLRGTGVSGEDAASPLLDGVDLTSLDVPEGSALGYTLPAGILPVVSAADGPLLAAGTVEGRRVAILALDPATSNLNGLPAFPILLRNIVRWSGAWLPATAALGDHLALELPPATMSIDVARRASLGAPIIATRVAARGGLASIDVRSAGIYTVTERGAWGLRSANLVANSGTRDLAGAETPISLPAPLVAGIDGGALPRTTWWPWLGLLAALALTAELMLAGIRKGERS